MFKKAIVHGAPVVLPLEYKTLPEMLVFIANSYPQKGLTYINLKGEETFISYPNLIHKAKLCLFALQNRGIKQGDTLILEIEDPLEFYYVFWACLFGGIIVAPITQPKSWNPASDKLSKLFTVWEVLDRPSIIIQEKCRSAYEKLQRIESYNNLNFIPTNELQSSTLGKISNLNENDIAILQFSSGSTDTPKGVRLTHKNIISNILAAGKSFHSQADDVVFSWLPHTHDMGLFCQVLTGIIYGCNIMLMLPVAFIRSPYLFLKKITDHKGTWFASPNFAYDWMTKKIPGSKLKELDLSSLRFTLNGAEPISIDIINKFVKKFSVCGYKPAMMQPAYGMAEATVGVTNTKIGAVPKVEKMSRSELTKNVFFKKHDEEVEDKIEFVHEGFPLDGISIRIASEQGEILQEREIGEIQIQGDCVTCGYYNNPEETKRLFQGNWLCTGDLGFITGRSLVVTGRKKDIIFVRGENYYAHDLEEVVYTQGAIRRGDLVFTGVFNSQLQCEELIAFIKHKGEYEPFVEISQKIMGVLQNEIGLSIDHAIPVKEIPRTTSGKLQRFKLRDHYLNGYYDSILKELKSFQGKSNQVLATAEYVRNEIENILVKIWLGILNISSNKINIDAPFFLLGGNSIKAFELLNQIEAYFEKEVDAEILVTCKTIRQQADYLSDLLIDSEEKCQLKISKKRGKYSKREAVAITGMAIKLPDAKDQNEFWQNLSRGKDSVKKISEKRKKLSGVDNWDDWIAELEDIDHFDNDFFEISDQEAIAMDPQQRLALETCYHVLEDAGMCPGLQIDRNIGVFSGISTNTYYQLVLDHLKEKGIDQVHQNTLIGNMCNMISAQVAHVFNFTGPAMVIDTACSSFLVAFHQAVKAIQERSIEGALVIGANIMATPLVHMLSKSAGIVSSTRYTKVFDKDADGSVLGEGIVAFYIEPLSLAQRDNKSIYAAVRGSAINNDGCSFGVMTPNPKGQFQVLLDAYEDADIAPSQVGYIEVHGTGTVIGDPIEMNVLSKLFSPHYRNHLMVGIGSVKSNIGHLLSAAGGAGLAKVLLCMKHKKIVPSLHMKTINPSVRLEQSPFYVAQTLQDWRTNNGNTRIAGLSSFGLGGTNAHVILEEANNELSRKSMTGIQVLALSAKTQPALDKMIISMQNFLKNHFGISDICYTLSRCRYHYINRAIAIININNRQKIQFIKSKNVLSSKLKALSFSGITNELYGRLKSILKTPIKLLDTNEKDVRLIFNENEVDLNIHLIGNKDEQLFFLLAHSYICGADVDWEVLYPSQSGKVISLPLYPFKHKPLWIKPTIRGD